MDNNQGNRVSIITALKWIKQGVAEEVPEKHVLSKGELDALLEESSRKLKKLHTSEDVDSDEEGPAPPQENQAVDDIEAKYGFDAYDDEEMGTSEETLNLTNLVVYSNNAEDEYMDDNMLDDSDEEDADCIHPDDNIIVVGHADDQFSTLEFHVYNEADKTFYPHHDIPLKSYPLVLEWLDFNPNSQEPGNFVAVGDFDPIISVYNVDIMNSIEPAYKLGKKGSKKKKIQGYGHKDSILDLAWNSSVRHILASGSVDKSLIIWDLNSGMPNTTLAHFKDKVQSLKWHPFEKELLLAGSCDGTIRLYDCQNPDQMNKSWSIEGEVEKLLWNPSDPALFLAGNNLGTLFTFDIRTPAPLSRTEAHQKAITGLTISSKCPGCLATTSEDGSLRIWDLQSGSAPELVYHQDANMGDLLAGSFSPDHPFTLALGGTNPENHFKILKCQRFPEVLQRFGSRLENPSSPPVHPALASSDIFNHQVPSTSSSDHSTLSLTKKKKKKTKNIL